MSEETTESVPNAQTSEKSVTRPKRRPWRKAKPHQAAAPTPKPANDCAGISATECCNACTADRCVISHINVCAHPKKGGLQPAQLRDPEAVKRFNRALKAIADSLR